MKTGYTPSRHQASRCNSAAVILPHDMETVFLSKTLFTVPDESLGNENNKGCDPAVLFAFPLDSFHIFVVYTAPTTVEEGASSFFVVQLDSGESNTPKRSALPIRAVSGCVRDHYCPNSQNHTFTGSRTLKVHAMSDAAAEDAASDLDSSVHTIDLCHPTVEATAIGVSGVAFSMNKRVPPQTASRASSMSGYSSRNRADGDVGEVRSPFFGGIDNKENGDTLLSAPLTSEKGASQHHFLLTDEASHAIWAVEVDTESLHVSVISPGVYWKQCGKHNTDSAHDDPAQHWQKQQQQEQGGKKKGTINAEEKQKEGTSIQHAKILLGGQKGFVDGPFHMARFASPSAMCWRMDEDPVRDSSVSCSVLFVSDTGNHAIRYVHFGNRMVRTVAGVEGVPGYRDGSYRLSQIHAATALAWCASGLLFTDGPNGAIRLITQLQHDQAEVSLNDGKNATPDKSRRHTPQRHSTKQRDDKKRLPVSPSPFKAIPNHQAPKVWTVAGGGTNSGNGTLYLDSIDVQNASLGFPSSMVLLPNGGGVLFSDKAHHALRRLCSLGVETVVGPSDYPQEGQVPRGLVACSHVTLCGVAVSASVSKVPTASVFLSPSSFPASCFVHDVRLGFLVSSGVHRVVSLLLPFPDEDNGEMTETELAAFQLGPSGTAALVAQWNETGTHMISFTESPSNDELKNGVLRVYTATQPRCGGLEALREREEKRGNGRRGRTLSLEMPRGCLKCAPSRRTHSCPAAGEGSGRLRESLRRLFDIYTHYATRTIASSPRPTRTRGGKIPHSTMKREERDERDKGVVYSLSLLQFWRFLAHADYLAQQQANLYDSNNNSSHNHASALFVRSKTGEESMVWNLTDVRTLTEVLHRLSVRRHGYRLLAMMPFSCFRRVIVLLYRREQQRLQRHAQTQSQDEQNGEEKNEKSREVKKVEVSGMLGYSSHLFCVSMDAPDINEEVAAYNDAIHRLEVWRKVGGGHDNDSTSDTREKLKAADVVMRLLARNEETLQQLFEAYSKTAMFRPTFTECTGNTAGDARSSLRHLRHIFRSIDSADNALDRISAMPFSRFRSLFQAVDVFPSLLSQSLLQRAFADALTTPLFLSLRKEFILNREKQDEQEQQNDQKLDDNMSLGMISCCRQTEKLCTSTNSSVSDNSNYVNSAVLSFIVFVEAFARVALTVFSLCGERDREMYPTAVAKLTALMRWVNRAVEMDRPTQHKMMQTGIKANGVEKRSTKYGTPSGAPVNFPHDIKLFKFHEKHNL